MSEEENNQSRARRNELLQDRIELQRENIDLLKEEYDLKEDIVQQYEDEQTVTKEQRKQFVEGAREKIKLLLLQKRLHGELTDTQKEELENLRDLIKTINDASAAMSEMEEATDSLRDAAAGLFGVNERYKKSLLGALEAVIKSGQGQEMLRQKLRDTFTAKNVLYSFTKKLTQATYQLAMSQDESLASFNKQTSAASLYGDEILSLEQTMFHHGITMDEATESYGALVSNVFGLKKMSSAARKELSTTTVLLNELGVEASTTAANVQFMTSSLGISSTQSAKYQRELFVLAKEIGMPPAEMAEAFKSASPKLAVFGRQAGKVFKDLVVNARAANMEVEQVLKIVEKFDTFEGAAESVGRLNALLGGPFLNSMEMVMETDPTQRMRMLSQALNNAGKSFDQMSYYEKKAIASAAGLSDVNELALVMAGNFNKSAGGAEMTQAEIQKLADETAQYQTVQEELMQTMRMFAISMRPVVTFVKATLQKIQELDKSIGPKGGPGLLSGLIFIGTAMLVLPKIMAAVTFATGLFTTATVTSNTALKKQQTLIFNSSKMMAASGKRMISLGLAALAMGIGVGVAALGVAQLVKALAPLDPGKMAAITVSIGALAVILAGMFAGLYFLVGSGVGNAVIAAFVAIGLTLAAVALSSAMLVEQLNGLFQVMSLGNVMGLSAAMGTLASAINISILAAPSLLLLAASVTAFGAALSTLDAEKIKTFTELFQALKEVTKESADNVMNMSTALGVASLALAAMAINPLAMSIMPAIVTGTGAASDINQVTTKTYVSESPTGIREKSKPGQAGGSKNDHLDVTVNIEVSSVFDRFFKASVTDVVRKATNANSG